MWVSPDAGHGVVWVCPQAIFLNWSRYAGSKAAPSATTVAETVRMMASGERAQRRFGDEKKWCFPVPFEVFVTSHVAEWGDFGYMPNNASEVAA